MSEWSITIQDVLTIAAVIGAVGGIYTVLSKPFKVMRELKESVDKLSETVGDMKDDLAMNGDMVYQLLNHAATNNNTGGMRDALDKYNEYYRH